MSAQTNQAATESAGKTFEERILAQMTEAEARIERFEAKAKEKRLQAELAALSALETARLNIEQKLQALSTLQEAHIARAKSDIDAAAAALKTSLDELGRRLSKISNKK